MENNLYLVVKNKICEMIYHEVYKDGENIPSERDLAQHLQVSRVTVRKALDLLEKDGIIQRVQGSGTKISLKQTGYKGTMDIIALLAPPQNPFFATFIDYFQQIAGENDSLVLFMQNPKDKKIEDSLFKLFQKNIRNVVIWLDDLKLDIEAIRRLRGLGMNIVFFDRTVVSPYADCVLLDNRDAVTMLYHYLHQKGINRVLYAGWDDLSLSSVKERQEHFLQISRNGDHLYHIPWNDKKHILNYITQMAEKIKNQEIKAEGIIAGDGEIGIAIKKVLKDSNLQSVETVTIDDFPQAKELRLSAYKQPFTELAKKVHECLLLQNKYPKKWKASVYKIKGELIIRENTKENTKEKYKVRQVHNGQ